MSRAPKNPVAGPGMEEGTTVEKKTCPKCGDEYGNLGNHIPSCDGEFDD